MNAISVDNVTKSFHRYVRVGRVRRSRTEVRAVDGISFSVEPGEMIGYIGPNGAGKSTTIKMLTGILTPTSGSISVAGLEPVGSRVQLPRRIGVVFGQRSQLWWDLPLSESFDLLRHLYRVEHSAHERTLAECRELLELDPLLSTPVRQLSLGQRMRGELTAALLHDPEILFLDEPTIGLDIVSKARVREFLAERNAERATTVVLTTHDLADIERLCGRIVVVDHGHVMYDGTIDSLRETFGPSRTLVVDLETSNATALQIPGTVTRRVKGPRQWIEFRRDTMTAAEAIAAVSRVAEIRDLTVEEPAIEDVIERLGRSTNGGLS